MPQNIPKKITQGEWFTISITFVLLVIFSTFFVLNILSAHRAGVFQNHHPISHLLLKNKETHTLSIEDIKYIDTWMTFQYINFVFNIPDAYLKDTLDIQDDQYPNLPLGRYIKTQKRDSNEYLNQVQEAVKHYLNSHTNK